MENKETDIFASDDALPDEEIDKILDRSHHIGSVAAYTVGGAAIAATALTLWRRYRPTNPFAED